MPDTPFLRHDRWDRYERSFRIAFFCLAALILLLMLAVVGDYGSSGDELTRYQYGKAVVHYFTGIDVGNHLQGGQLHGRYEEGYFQPYGALFDAPVTLLIHWLKPADEYLARHYCNMLVGFAGMIIASLIGKEITGKWSGALLTLILFAITPRYWGESFNNPKDIPFAASAMFFVLILFRWLRHIETQSWKQTLLMALALALPLCIRPGGLLFITYFMMIAGIAFLANKQLRTTRYCIRVLLIFVIAYFGCIFFWPEAYEHPLTAQVLAFKSQSKYLVTISVLFEGFFTDCKNLPWYYTHKLLLITLPLIVVAGFICSLVLLWRKKNDFNRLFLGLLLFFALFPLTMMILRGTVLYDGIRQVLFLMTFMMIGAAVGLWQVLQLLRTRTTLIAGVLVIALGLALPLRYSLANHPHQYIYYNELTGGVKGAFSNYELDYYYNSARQAYDWLQQHEGGVIRSSGDSLVLASDCYKHMMHNYNAAGKLPLKIIDGNLFTQHKSNWDYAIFFSRYLDKDELQNGYFNSPKAIHTIKADGAPICIILKNDSLRYGYKAHLALNADDTVLAETYLLKAVAQYPGDVELWTDLTLLYLGKQDPDKAKWAIDHALKISPINHNSVHLSWEAAFMKKDIPKALEILAFATRYYKGTDAPWLRLAEAQVMAGDLPHACQSLQKAVPYDRKDSLLLIDLRQKTSNIK